MRHIAPTASSKEAQSYAIEMLLSGCASWVDRFWGNVDIKTEDECWLWSIPTKSAYPSFYISIYMGKQISILSHRLSYIISRKEKVPPGMCVCHKCDTPFCVNPAHLFLGTQQDNQADKTAKHRQSRGEKHRDAIMPNRPRGENVATSRLTNEQALSILRMKPLRYRGLVKDLALKFGVSPSTVCAVWSGQNWRHLNTGGNQCSA
jgi:hypothetical protein